MKRTYTRSKAFFKLSDRVISTPQYGRQKASNRPRLFAKRWGKKYRFRRYVEVELQKMIRFVSPYEDMYRMYKFYTFNNRSMV